MKQKDPWGGTVLLWVIVLGGLLWFILSGGLPSDLDKDNSPVNVHTNPTPKESR